MEFLLYCIIIMIATVAADQLTKVLVLEHLAGGAGFPLIPGVFHFTYVENRGAAFGMLSEHRWIFMVLSVIAIGVLVLYLAIAKPKSLLMRTAVALIAGGGIGNMIDRAIRGFVVDFIDVKAVWQYVFNVADAAVCVGCGLLILWLILSEVKEKKSKSA